MTIYFHVLFCCGCAESKDTTLVCNKGSGDRTKAVRRLSWAASYCVNTTNMSAYLACHHLELKTEQAKQLAAASQRTLDGTLSQLPSSS